MAKSSITYEITESVGVISTNPRGWTKELNKVSWNDRDPKYDIRDWSPEHDKMGKGITLTDEEATALAELILKDQQ